jgi:hypothetical protein
MDVSRKVRHKKMLDVMAKLDGLFEALTGPDGQPRSHSRKARFTVERKEGLIKRAAVALDKISGSGFESFSEAVFEARGSSLKDEQNALSEAGQAANLVVAGMYLAALKLLTGAFQELELAWS